MVAVAGRFSCCCLDLRTEVAVSRIEPISRFVRVRNPQSLVSFSRPRPSVMGLSSGVSERLTHVTRYARVLSRAEFRYRALYVVSVLTSFGNLGEDRSLFRPDAALRLADGQLIPKYQGLVQHPKRIAGRKVVLKDLVSDACLTGSLTVFSDRVVLP